MLIYYFNLSIPFKSVQWSSKISNQNHIPNNLLPMNKPLQFPEQYQPDKCIINNIVNNTIVIGNWIRFLQLFFKIVRSEDAAHILNASFLGIKKSLILNLLRLATNFY